MTLGKVELCVIKHGRVDDVCDVDRDVGRSGGDDAANPARAKHKMADGSLGGIVLPNQRLDQLGEEIVRAVWAGNLPENACSKGGLFVKLGGCVVHASYFDVHFVKLLATANDPNVSDGGGWRGLCMVGGKAGAEGAGVTVAPVRCSAWLSGVDHHIIRGLATINRLDNPCLKWV